MPLKNMTVRVNPDATVNWEGRRRRPLPHGEVLTVPCTAYYLRHLHQGNIVRADEAAAERPVVTTAEAATPARKGSAR